MTVHQEVGLLSLAGMLLLSLPGGNVAAQAPDSGCGLQVRLSRPTVPGTEMVHDVMGRKLHCTTYGKGSPTVVLISGFGAPQQAWAPVIGELAKASTVLTYDRAGYGRSEAPQGDTPINGMQSAEDLWRLLQKAQVPAPYLVVGHSMGADVARLFTTAHPDRVCGLILEDGSHEDLGMETHRGAMQGKDREVVEQMAKGMPGTSGVMKRESSGGDRTKELLRSSPPLPRVPFVVLTSGSRRAPPMLSEAGQRTWTEVGLAYQKKLAALIPGGRHVTVGKAGHVIHQDDPGALIGAVEWTMTEARKRDLLH